MIPIPYRKVLLIDDDPVQIAILSAYFSALRVPHILTAENSLRALDLLAESDGDIDLIVSDLQMPQMDGLEFLRHLKGRQFTGRLAIMSGVKSDILEHAGRLAKLQGLNLIGKLGKPVSKAGLDRLFLADPLESGTGKDAQPGDRQRLQHGAISRESLLQAISEGRIVPYFQPKIDTKTRTIYGAEALARWLDREGNVIHTPDRFIPVAEQSGLIVTLTESLLAKGLEAIVGFRRLNPALHFAFNLTPSMMRNLKLPDRICAMLRQAGLPANSVGFEITEDAALDPDARTLEVLSRLRIHDFELAIDDFGTGHANIANLRNFPYTELKIDSSFVLSATRDSFSLQTIKSAVGLARELGMSVVAEGVEDHATWDLVRGFGIERVQGFLFGRAMDAGRFAAFIEQCRTGVKTAA